MAFKRHLVRYALGMLILAVLLAHSVQIHHIGLIDRLDAIFYDARVRLTMPNTVDDRIVILDIDEKSLAEQGRWPWGRDRLATLMDKLFDRHEIALIGFDVVFAEPDVSSGIDTLERLAKDELRGNADYRKALRDLRPALDYDARFAASLKDRRVVLGYYLSKEEDGGRSSGALPEPSLPAESFDGKRIDFTRWQTHGGNLPALQESAAAAGHFNPMIDFDGITRRVPLLAEYQGQYYESLSLAMLRVLLDNPPIFPGFGEASSEEYDSLEWLELPTEQGTVRIPVDENAAALVPYRGERGSFPYVSVTDVLHDRIEPGRLKDRIVLVGTTASGLMDLRATPVSAIYPGVEAHANLLSGMLDGTLKHRPAYSLAVDVLLVLLAGLAMVFLMPVLSPFKATLLAISIASTLAAINLAFWEMGHLVMPFANGLTLVLLLYALNMSWGYFVESRTKRQLTGLFGQYVPPELVEEMSRDPENYSMAGRKAELTVLFSDVRGFTTISEGLQPDELATLMNEYLGAMTEVIRHERGTLDKYIGDAIMAFWGAPMGDPQHARHALLGALGMMARLPELNRALVAKGWPALKIGIGVNTGTMTVGDMGSPVRQSYTVMGDAVNLGSRLEGITKQYGVGIIVGEGTREHLGDEFVLRELDRVRVKGKAEPVGIYEPLGISGSVSAEILGRLQTWNEALLAYRHQDWDRAEALLAELSAAEPHYLYDLYAGRIAHYRQAPPEPQWDGVTTFETK